MQQHQAFTDIIHDTSITNLATFATGSEVRSRLILLSGSGSTQSSSYFEDPHRSGTYKITISVTKNKEYGMFILEQ